MHTILEKIGAGIATLGLVVSGWFGYTPPSQDVTGATVNPYGGMTYTLSGNGVTGSATSITLQSLTLPQSGQKIADSDLSATFYLTLEPGNRTRQEFVSCTTVTQNSAGTATLSGCSRGLSPIPPYSASTTLQFVHAGGSQAIFSDPPQVFNQYAAKDNAELIPGLWTASSTNPWRYDADFTVGSTTRVFAPANWVEDNFLDILKTGAISLAGTYTFTNLPLSSATCTTATQFCNKDYIDAQVIAGGTNSSETVRGISETATKAEIAAGTRLGATGAVLYIPAEAATSTRQVATTTVIVSNTSGYLDNSFVNGQNYIFGNSTTTNATTTNLQVSGTASTTNLIISGTCTGCSSSNVQTFTSSNTWTKPASGSYAIIQAWGAGASGGKAAASGSSGGGGGGGSYVVRLMALSDLGATETVTIGAGGTAVTVANTDGNAGGNTTFGAHVTAYGGRGGDADGGGGSGAGVLAQGDAPSGSAGAGGGRPVSGAGGTADTGGAGGDSTDGGGGGGGDRDAAGSTGGIGGYSSNGGAGGGGGSQDSGNGGAGGNSLFGGAGGGGASDSGTGGAGGDSIFGGDGGAGATNADNATAGSQPGGGGGGSETGNSGAGGAGKVVVTVF